MGALDTDLAEPSATVARAARIRFALSSDAALLNVGNRLLLMAQGGKRFFELPRWIEPLWSALDHVSDDLSLGQMLADHLSIIPKDAEAMAFELLRDWSHHGLARLEMADTEPFLSAIHFRLADCGIVLGFDDEDIAAMVRPLFEHVICGDAAPAMLVSVRRCGDFALVEHQGTKTVLVRQAEAGPATKGLILEAILADRRYPVALHAACVALGGRAILLAGQSGAGKTLFSLAAAREGFGYCADDVVLVDQRGRIRGVPFAPAMKASGWAFGAIVDNFGLLGTHLRLDGVAVRYPPPPSGFIETPLPIGATILLDRRADGPVQLDPIDPVEAFVALLSEASAPLQQISAAHCQTLASMIAARPCYRLSYSDVRAATATLYRALHDPET